MHPTKHDRELLERAARAGGLTLVAMHDSAEPGYEFRRRDEADKGWMRLWDPLTDKAQAEELAAACGISYGRGADGRLRVAWQQQGAVHFADMPLDSDSPNVPLMDETAWLCRTIVHAAAEFDRGPRLT